MILNPVIAFNSLLLLANRSYSISWALILLSVILGLMITLRPARRASEVKKPHRD